MLRELSILCLVAACGSVESKPVDAAPPADAVDAAPAVDARFGDGTLSFEELPAGTVTTPFTFASGVVLTEPTPNPGGSSGLITIDCTGDSGFFGFSCANSRSQIPEGVKFLGFDQLRFGEIIEFTFPSDITGFGIAVSTSGSVAGEMYTVRGFDRIGAMVANTTISSSTIPQWRGNRAAISAPAGFRTVQIAAVAQSNNIIVVDDVRWIAGTD